MAILKVGVTGAHGTGKTRLAKLLAGRHKLRMLPDVAVEALHQEFSVNETTSLETEIWIFAKQLERERKYNSFVADKCFIDLLAYLYHLFPEEKELQQRLTNIALPYIKKYDLVIFLPAGEFPIEDDGFRSIDPTFQMKIDAIIRDILKNTNTNYVTVTGTPEKRFAVVADLLK